MPSATPPISADWPPLQAGRLYLGLCGPGQAGQWARHWVEAWISAQAATAEPGPKACGWITQTCTAELQTVWAGRSLPPNLTVLHDDAPLTNRRQQLLPQIDRWGLPGPSCWVLENTEHWLAATPPNRPTDGLPALRRWCQRQHSCLWFWQELASPQAVHSPACWPRLAADFDGVLSVTDAHSSPQLWQWPGLPIQRPAAWPGPLSPEEQHWAWRAPWLHGQVTPDDFVSGVQRLLSEPGADREITPHLAEHLAMVRLPHLSHIRAQDISATTQHRPWAITSLEHASYLLWLAPPAAERAARLAQLLSQPLSRLFAGELHVSGAAAVLQGLSRLQAEWQDSQQSHLPIQQETPSPAPLDALPSGPSPRGWRLLQTLSGEGMP